MKKKWTTPAHSKRINRTRLFPSLQIIDFHFQINYTQKHGNQLIKFYTMYTPKQPGRVE